MRVTLTNEKLEELLFELLQDERWGMYLGLPQFQAKIIVADYVKKIKELYDLQS